MDRRRFLTTASYGLGLSVSMIEEGLAQTDSSSLTKQPLRRLAPPEDGLINVACAISKGTTEIDYIGPQAVFETWYRDPVTHKPAPRFKIFTVSESLDAVDGRIPDYTFDNLPLRFAKIAIGLQIKELADLLEFVCARMILRSCSAC